jgi:hypothetical protein
MTSRFVQGQPAMVRLLHWYLHQPEQLSPGLEETYMNLMVRLLQPLVSGAVWSYWSIPDPASLPMGQQQQQQGQKESGAPRQQGSPEREEPGRLMSGLLADLVLREGFLSRPGKLQVGYQDLVQLHNWSAATDTLLLDHCRREPVCSVITQILRIHKFTTGWDGHVDALSNHAITTRWLHRLQQLSWDSCRDHSKDHVLPTSPSTTSFNLRTMLPAGGALPVARSGHCCSCPAGATGSAEWQRGQQHQRQQQ